MGIFSQGRSGRFARSKTAGIDSRYIPSLNYFLTLVEFLQNVARALYIPILRDL